MTLPTGISRRKLASRRASAASSVRSQPVCKPAHVTARYIAPVSRKSKPRRRARARAVLLFPAPAGPSMVTTVVMSHRADEHRSLRLNGDNAKEQAHYMTTGRYSQPEETRVRSAGPGKEQGLSHLAVTPVVHPRKLGKP